MKTAQFSDPQFLDAAAPGGLNPAFGLVSGSFASVGLGAWAAPGLSAPEAMTVSFSGMVATIGLPSPWGLVSSGGVMVRAHGTQTGLDTHTYTVDLGPLVPVSSTLTAYVAATISTIQQGPFPVPGPPPGHPSYDPNTVPTIAYAATVYTVALSAVPGGIDNVGTFELLRTVLSAGQTAVTGWSTAGQARAADRDSWPAILLTSGGLLSAGQAQFMLVPTVSGLTHTLPPASGAGGLMFGGANPTNGNWTFATTGSDLIEGSGTTGLASLAVPPSGAVMLWGNAASGLWQIIGFSPNMTPQQVQQWTAGPVSGVTGDVTVSGGVLTVPTHLYTFDESSPPGTPISLGVMDKLIITFENVASIPLHVACGQGVYRVTVVVAATNTNNSDWQWKPNDTTYIGAFSYTGYRAADSGQGNWYAGTYAYFYFDLFGNINPNEPINVGPNMQEFIASTFTTGKTIKQSGLILGGPSMSASLWNDTTTAWTSLGTLVDLNATSMTGIATV